MNDKINAIGTEDNKAMEALKRLWDRNQNGQDNQASFVAHHPNSVFGNGFASNNNTQNA